MRRGYKRRYDWDILGKHCGINIIGRLDWINGKPMVWTALINLFLLAVNAIFNKYCMDVPEVVTLTSFWGWNLFNTIAKIVFGVLFVDGVIVRILWTYTRGEYYCSYFARLIWFPHVDNRTQVKEMLSWAHFLHTHPDFDYRLQELHNHYGRDRIVAGQKGDPAGFARARQKLIKEYGVIKDENGKYFTWNDKKYKKLLEKL